MCGVITFFCLTPVLVSLLTRIMSDKWAEIDNLKFKDKISVGSASPSLNKTFVEHSPIALSLFLTNNFLKELFSAHKQTNLSYLDIVNSQLSGFQLLFVITNDTHDDVVYLLREFHSIHEFISKTVSVTFDKEKLFQRIKIWMLKFQSLSSKGRLGYSKVIPYMHCFMYHIPTFIDKYGKLGAFSGQSVEKLNDSVKLIHQKKGSK